MKTANFVVIISPLDLYYQDLNLYIHNHLQTHRKAHMINNVFIDMPTQIHISSGTGNKESVYLMVAYVNWSRCSEQRINISNMRLVIPHLGKLKKK